MGYGSYPKGAGARGLKGDKGDPGDAGAAGPTWGSVRIPGSLTTSSGVQIILAPGPLLVEKTLPANSIKAYFGTGYSASNTTNWLWLPGYMVPGSPGSIVDIGSGRQNNVAGGAVIAKSVETYTHSQVTVPLGAVLLVRATPTSFPSANAGPADMVWLFYTSP